MNILSIDFDYFQIVDKDILKDYPDGIDLPTGLSELVWASKYAFNSDIEKVTVNQNELDTLSCIISHMDPQAPVCVSQSHKEIYSFIHKLQPNTAKPLKVVNVDMHHDYFNDNRELDCGNWISYLSDEYTKFKWMWIANPISLDVYEAEEIKPLVKQSLTEIEDLQFDALFLCRSDNWVPPHLDNSFVELINVIQNRFTERNVDIRDRVDKPRTQWKNHKDQLREMFTKIKK